MVFVWVWAAPPIGAVFFIVGILCKPGLVQYFRSVQLKKIQHLGTLTQASHSKIGQAQRKKPPVH